MLPAGFDLPVVLYAGLPVALLLLTAAAWRLARAGVSPGRVVALLALRGTAVLIVVFVLARPVSLVGLDTGARRRVALLVDRSRSMGLPEAGRTRYQRALALGAELTPALRRLGFEVEPFLFDATVAPGPLPAAAAGAADGTRTDLGAAIRHALLSAAPPPAAVVALTDGAANESAANAQAMLALIEAPAPFLGIGVGDDRGVPTLSLHRVTAPAVVPPRQTFRVSAQLQATGDQAVPDFDLVLLRDGQATQSRRITGGHGSRFWSEGFEVSEADEGGHEYGVVLRPPGQGVVPVSTRGSARVRVGKEKDFRVLFVQGALTWDFKFIGRALRGDPAVRVTGLSRTSKQSVFRQNVESAGELLGGFPEDLAQLAPYRVLVLSDMRPAELTPAQQELVARFCGELGGGVLLIGGPATFDTSWQGTRLEQLLPVSFDPAPDVAGLDRPFHLRLTEAARRSAVFQVKDDGSSERVWDALPTFTQYGRVLAEKPGAVVWARHDQDSGPGGRRILMASQAYGAGVSTVITVQNLWRWRLAKDADPATFDRFWQQLFRHLGQSGRQEVTVQFLDQEIRPHGELRALVERGPRPDGTEGAPAGDYTVRVRDAAGAVLMEQKTRLLPGRPVGVTFRAGGEGVHVVEVSDARGAGVARHTLDVREVDREMERTGRDMDNLTQWASVSGGLALREEECTDAAGLAARVKAQVEQRRRSRRVPYGVNGGVLAGLLGALCAEWALRRRWGLA
jgi:uncharacterized membrane protein